MPYSCENHPHANLTLFSEQSAVVRVTWADENFPSRKMLDCQQAQASTGRPPPMGQERISLSALWQTLIRTHRLPEGTEISTLITLIRDRLHDPEKEVRQHALRVLADIIPVLPRNSLQIHLSTLLPSMIINLGHNSVAVRKSVVDCLKVFIRYSPTPNEVFMEIIDIDDETSPNILNGILTSMPSFLRPEFLNRHSIEKAIKTLWNYSRQCVNEEICMKSLAKIRWKIGVELFNKLFDIENSRQFDKLCEKYGLLKTPPDDEYSSSSSEDKLILETEFQLDSGPSIKLQIHEESSDNLTSSSDQGGIVRIFDDDDSEIEFFENARETPRTPRRVHFGGEIVKMRTPESDSTQASDSEGRNVKKLSSTINTPLPPPATTKIEKENLNEKKIMSSSVDNIKINNKEGVSKIPLPLSSVPNSPTKKSLDKVEKSRLHNSAPNLSKNTKLPKKLTPEKEKSSDSSNESVLNLVNESNTYKIKEPMKMIELNIKNNIALQIKFDQNNDSVKITPSPSNGSENPQKKGEKQSNPTKSQTTPLEEKSDSMKEESSPTKEKFDSTKETLDSEKENFDSAKEKFDSAKEKFDFTKEKFDSTKEKFESPKEKFYSTREIADHSKEKSKHQSTKKTNTSLQAERKDDGAPMIDEEVILKSMCRPRTYSRTEGVLSPGPIHNEIEIIHNLGRSPEPSRKSRPTTAVGASRQNSGNVKSDKPAKNSENEKNYESFKVCNNRQQEERKSNEVAVEEVEVSNNKSSEVMTQPSSRSIELQRPLTLSKIVENLQELDLTKKTSAFDGLIFSFQNENFIKSFDTPNTTSLLQLLFLYETQARFRHGSRDALQKILKYVEEDVIRECLPQIAKGIGRMGAPYGIKLAITAMKRPHLAGELLDNLPYESGRGREGSLQILMAACRLFPRSYIDVNKLTKRVVIALTDKRRKIRHAALETLASLAQVSDNYSVFEIAKEVVQGDRCEEMLLRVMRSRLSRRQLPLVDFDGNIRYTVPRDPVEIEWLSSGGANSNHSAPIPSSHCQKTFDSGEKDDFLQFRPTNAAVIPLSSESQKKLKQCRGVLRPVYCILPSPEESDEGPFYYAENKRGRTILPLNEKLRCESQDRIRWRGRGSKRFPLKYDMRKSFSSDQLYNHHNQPISLDRNNLTSTSSISSGSDYSSSNGSQNRSFRWQGSSGIPILRPKGYWGPSRIQQQDSPSSLRNVPQRQSTTSGSESSGYFTPPPAERPPTDRITPENSKNVEDVPDFKATTPSANSRTLCNESNEPSQDQPSQPQESEVEYIEILNKNPMGEKIENEIPVQATEDHGTNNQSSVDVDEVDRSRSYPNLNDFDLNQPKPIDENRKWSKSEFNLERKLPLVERKNVTSAPSMKDIVSRNTEETLTGTTHICNNTNINITIPIPGALVDERDEETPPPLVRRLSKRYSQVPIPKRTVRAIKTESAKNANKPKIDAVQNIINQMSSPEWEIVMNGLKNLGKLAKSNSDSLENHMHSVSSLLANHIKNLRSQVARAACQASREMFITCSQKGMESELEEIVAALLHRTADTNKFLREDANNALDMMVDTMNPVKVVVILTTKGTTHQNAIVRCTTTRLLEKLVKSNGTDKMFSLGKDIRDRIILAGANALTEGSLETRKHAKTLFSHMIAFPNFQKALVEAVPPHTIRHIAKTLNSLKSSC